MHVHRTAICESKDRAMHKLMVERGRYKEQLEKEKEAQPTRGNAAPGPAPATPTPSGGPASWPRWLATPRAPPRPRGGENRAGERVPQLFVLEPTGPAGQRTKRTFFVPGGAGPPWHT